MDEMITKHTKVEQILLMLSLKVFLLLKSPYSHHVDLDLFLAADLGGRHFIPLQAHLPTNQTKIHSKEGIHTHTIFKESI